MPSTTHRRHAAASRPRAPTREAIALFRRPFAPGAIGFRAMTKVPLQRRPVRRRAGRRLHRRPVGPAAPELRRPRPLAPAVRAAPRPSCSPPAATASAARRRYLACRLIVTLPLSDGGPDVEAVYEDIGEMRRRLARRR